MNWTYYDLTVKEFNDLLGTIKVDLKIERGKTKLTRELTVFGFKSVDPENGRILEEVYEVVVNRLSQANIAHVLPSDLSRVGSLILFDTFNLKKPTDEELHHAELDMYKVDYNDKEGWIKINIHIQIKSLHLRRNYVMGGFMTRQEHDQNKVAKTLKFIREKTAWVTTAIVTRLRSNQVHTTMGVILEK
ncbi:lipoprotein 17-related variable surface protein [Mycoplasma sp. ATU-Cv-508]|uniref:lipoprotein 17-related variable surface protein n=1 Tax=Mycoplasma sp. ATU-Cv-508 TaxID=2048001 RepID=UPI000FDE1F9C